MCTSIYTYTDVRTQQRLVLILELCENKSSGHVACRRFWFPSDSSLSLPPPAHSPSPQTPLVRVKREKGDDDTLMW
jgi:hypothetical protein